MELSKSATEAADAARLRKLAKLATHGPYTQGTTLLTPITRRWTKEQLAANDAIERRLVFANFHDRDQGRSRVLVARCEREEDAAFIVAALNAVAQAAGRSPQPETAQASKGATDECV